MLDKIKDEASSYLRDAVGIAGAFSISYGASMIYAPAGYIVGGLLAIGIVVLIEARA